MSIALAMKVRELEGRIAELETRRCPCDNCKQAPETPAAQPVMALAKRKPGRPPKNGT